MYLLKYILKRVGLMLLTFIVIFTMCFVLVKLLPNTPDPQPGKDYEIIMRRREMLGYDKPIMEQYWIYWFGRTGYTFDKMENTGNLRKEGTDIRQKMTFTEDGHATENGIKLTVADASTVRLFVTAMSVGDEAKTLALCDSTGTPIEGMVSPKLPTTIDAIEFEIPAAGTYYIAGNHRVCVYYIALTTGENTVVVNMTDLEAADITTETKLAEGISVVATANDPVTISANGNKVQEKENGQLVWVMRPVLDEEGEPVYVQNDKGEYLDSYGQVTEDPARFVPVEEYVLDEEGKRIPVYATVTVYDKAKLPDYVSKKDCKTQGVGGMIRGNFGVSEVLYHGSDVWKIFTSKVPFTVAINVYSMVLSIPFGILLGIYAALRKNKWQDHVISTGVMIFVSVPSFIYAFLVHYVLYFKLGWTPVAAIAVDGPWSWSFFSSVLGAILSMSFGTIAGFARYTRAELTEVLTSEFMLLARTKGLTKAQAVMRHALRNAMVVIFPMILGEFISVMSGSLIIEQLFSIPGVGKLYISAVQAQPTPDYNFFMLLTGFYTFIGLAAGIVIDISYGIIDPRIRMGAR